MQTLVRTTGPGAGHVVVKVAFERSISGSHEHIAGVWTSGDAYVTRDAVLRSIALGDAWWSIADGRRVAVRRVTHCPWPGCSLIPYLYVSGSANATGDDR